MVTIEQKAMTEYHYCGQFFFLYFVKSKFDDSKTKSLIDDFIDEMIAEDVKIVIDQQDTFDRINQLIKVLSEKIGCKKDILIDLLYNDYFKMAVTGEEFYKKYDVNIKKYEKLMKKIFR